jgi:hypothetical protein
MLILDIAPFFLVAAFQTFTFLEFMPRTSLSFISTGAMIGMILDRVLNNIVIDSLLIISKEPILAPHGLNSCRVPFEIFFDLLNVLGGHSGIWSLTFGCGSGTWVESSTLFVSTGSTSCKCTELSSVFIPVCSTSLSVASESSHSFVPVEASSATGDEGSHSAPLALPAAFRASTMTSLRHPAQHMDSDHCADWPNVQACCWSCRQCPKAKNFTSQVQKLIILYLTFELREDLLADIGNSE